MPALIDSTSVISTTITTTTTTTKSSKSQIPPPLNNHVNATHRKQDHQKPSTTTALTEENLKELRRRQKGEKKYVNSSSSSPYSKGLTDSTLIITRQRGSLAVSVDRSPTKNSNVSGRSSSSNSSSISSVFVRIQIWSSSCFRNNKNDANGDQSSRKGLSNEPSSSVYNKTMTTKLASAPSTTNTTRKQVLRVISSNNNEPGFVKKDKSTSPLLMQENKKKLLEEKFLKERASSSSSVATAIALDDDNGNFVSGEAISLEEREIVVKDKKKMKKNEKKYVWADMYRPKALKHFICNRDKADYLHNLVKEGEQCSHYIFEGPAGVGKTTMVWAFLREALGVEDLLTREERKTFELKGEVEPSITVRVKVSSQYVEINLSQLHGYEKHVIAALIRETQSITKTKVKQKCGPTNCFVYSGKRINEFTEDQVLLTGWEEDVANIAEKIIEEQSPRQLYIIRGKFQNLIDHNVSPDFIFTMDIGGVLDGEKSSILLHSRYKESKGKGNIDLGKDVQHFMMIEALTEENLKELRRRQKGEKKYVNSSSSPYSKGLTDSTLIITRQRGSLAVSVDRSPTKNSNVSGRSSSSNSSSISSVFVRIQIWSSSCFRNNKNDANGDQSSRKGLSNEPSSSVYNKTMTTKLASAPSTTNTTRKQVLRVISSNNNEPGFVKKDKSTSPLLMQENKKKLLEEKFLKERASSSSSVATAIALDDDNGNFVSGEAISLEEREIVVKDKKKMKKNEKKYVWADMYRPKALKHFICNRDKADYLHNLVKEGEQCSHYIFEGPAGVGKTTMVWAFLREALGVEDLLTREERKTFELKGEVEPSITVRVKVSSQYVEINLSQLHGYEKHVIAALIRETQSITKTKRNFQTSTSKIYFYCYSTLSTIKQGVLKFIAEKECIQLQTQLAERIAENSKHNLRQAIRSFEATWHFYNEFTEDQVLLTGWEEDVANIAEKIIEEQSPRQLYIIRGKFQNLIDHNVSPDFIFTLRRRQKGEKKYVNSSSSSPYSKGLTDSTLIITRQRGSLAVSVDRSPTKNSNVSGRSSSSNSSSISSVFVRIQIWSSSCFRNNKNDANGDQSSRKEAISLEEREIVVKDKKKMKKNEKNMFGPICPAGVGKTTMVWAFLREALGVEDLLYQLINKRSNSCFLCIDKGRAQFELLKGEVEPTIIIHEADKLSRDAQLYIKWLMERNNQGCTKVFFCCSETSRLQHLRSISTIVEVLKFIAEKECIQLQTQPKELQKTLNIIFDKLFDLSKLHDTFSKHHHGQSIKFPVLHFDDRSYRFYAKYICSNEFTEDQVLLTGWEEDVANIAEKIIEEQSPRQLYIIRGKFQNLIDHNVSPDFIFTMDIGGVLDGEKSSILLHSRYKESKGKGNIDLGKDVQHFMMIEALTEENLKELRRRQKGEKKYVNSSSSSPYSKGLTDSTLIITRQRGSLAVSVDRSPTKNSNVSGRSSSSNSSSISSVFVRIQIWSSSCFRNNKNDANGDQSSRKGLSNEPSSSVYNKTMTTKLASAPSTTNTTRKQVLRVISSNNNEPGFVKKDKSTSPLLMQENKKKLLEEKFLKERASSSSSVATAIALDDDNGNFVSGEAISLEEREIVVKDKKKMKKNEKKYVWADMYRPKALKHFICNRDKADYLHNLVKEGEQCSHYIFEGPAGVGKTTMVWAFLREALGVEDLLTREERKTFELKGEVEPSITVRVKVSSQYVEINLSQLHGYEKHVIAALIRETQSITKTKVKQKCGPTNCFGTHYPYISAFIL
ncbi:hypothetical protein C5167_004564 [Papaver somniferum]|uniref:Uncharacterized protein n=1 Tax=Papaver somniferum TaxID=3469 RepID=A0A4Y7JBY6_PAPSO|nr:hypothetical protein C5167_004564 [Papaver somniferum]